MLTVREIKKILKEPTILGRLSGPIKGISTDTRTIHPGELFIPLSGQNFAGRKFIPQALAKGALALDVEDGLQSLHTLAAYHRSRFKIPIIGVTGSVGKTTTKDMIASILAQKYPTLKNEENFNNEIGVPLTLLKLTKKHRAAVIEMAMQRLGEIRQLAAVVRPTIAVVTNIGEAHLEFLKTRRNIARAKAEIFRFLRREDWAVINQDDEFFEHLKGLLTTFHLRLTTFGLLEKADVTPQDLHGIKLPLPGEHNIYNALAAVAVARIVKVPGKTIKAGLENFRPSSRRMEVINRADGVKIINDTYNASPSSMAAMLRTLAALEGRKIAVLGDMLELGRLTRAAHRRILALARRLKIENVFTLGANWPPAPRPFSDKKKLIKFLKHFIRPRDIILVKGSRGMKLEEVADALR